jgi:hypothetical protein
VWNIQNRKHIIDIVECGREMMMGASILRAPLFTIPMSPDVLRTDLSFVDLIGD